MSPYYYKAKFNLSQKDVISAKNIRHVDIMEVTQFCNLR